MQCYAIEMLPLQGLITACDELQLTAHYQHSENGRLIYSGATRYNPQLRNHRVIIGCRTFRDLLMWQTDASNFVFANKGIIDPCAACHVTAPPPAVSCSRYHADYGMADRIRPLEIIIHIFRPSQKIY